MVGVLVKGTVAVTKHYGQGKERVCLDYASTS